MIVRVKGSYSKVLGINFVGCSADQNFQTNDVIEREDLYT